MWRLRPKLKGWARGADTSAGKWDTDVWEASMRCSSCDSDHLVVIHLTISAEQVALYRCPRCDTRMWSGEEGPMTRDGVLELVRSGR